MFPTTPKPSHNKGLTLKHENVLSWLNNDFVLTVIKTAY